MPYCILHRCMRKQAATEQKVAAAAAPAVAEDELTAQQWFEARLNAAGP